VPSSSAQFTTHTAFQYKLVSIITKHCNELVRPCFFMGGSWVSMYVHRCYPRLRSTPGQCKWLCCCLSLRSARALHLLWLRFPYWPWQDWHNPLVYAVQTIHFFMYMYTNWLKYVHVLPFFPEKGGVQINRSRPDPGVDPGVRGNWPPHDHYIEDYIMTN